MWPKMLRHAGLVKAERIEVWVDKNRSLCRIINASITAAKRNNNKNKLWQITHEQCVNLELAELPKTSSRNLRQLVFSTASR